MFGFQPVVWCLGLVKTVSEKCSTEVSHLYECNQPSAKPRMHIHSKEYAIFCHIDPNPLCRVTFRGRCTNPWCRIILGRTKTHYLSDVLKNKTMSSNDYKLTTNLTSSPLLWGIKCAASHSSTRVTTQAFPSRSMTSVLKRARRLVMAVDVSRSFKQR